MDAPQNAGPYDARLGEIRAALAGLEARSGRISTLRGVTFLAAAALALARMFGPVPAIVWALAAAAAAAFVALVVAHAILVTRTVELELRARLLERGQKRIRGELADLPDKGERFAAPGHAYAGDLDALGSASLYQLVASTETGPGERVLARWLLAPAPAKEIAARQEAVRELAAMPRFREDLAACAAASGTKGRDADPFLAWAEDAQGGPSPALLLVGRALVPLTLALAGLSETLSSAGPSWLRLLWVAPLVAQLAVLAMLRGPLEPVLAVAGSSEAPFGRYAGLFRLIEVTSFASPRLAALRETLTKGGASRAIGSLERVVGFAELRHSGIAAVLANLFLLWDVFVGVSLIHWREQHGADMRRFVDAMAELEALASLGTFAAEHPD